MFEVCERRKVRIEDLTRTWYEDLKLDQTSICLSAIQLRYLSSDIELPEHRKGVLVIGCIVSSICGYACEIEESSSTLGYTTFVSENCVQEDETKTIKLNPSP